MPSTAFHSRLLLLTFLLAGNGADAAVEPDRLDGGGTLAATASGVRLHGAITPLGVPDAPLATVGSTRMQADVIPLLYAVALRNAASPLWLQLTAALAPAPLRVVLLAAAPAPAEAAL